MGLKMRSICAAMLLLLVFSICVDAWSIPSSPASPEDCKRRE